MSDHEPEPQGEPEPQETGDADEPATGDSTVGRCEAQTEMSTGSYRCALDAGHDGEHSFAPVDPSDTGEPSEAELAAEANDEEVKGMQRAVRNYSKAIVGVLGPDLGPFTLCPCCSPMTPGLYIDHPHDEAEMAQLRSIVGLPSLDNYKRDNNYATCATCDGLGTVLTGSKVPAKMTARCFACNGDGFIIHDPSRQATAAPPPPNGAPPEGHPVPGDPPPYDPWGRPYGDPDYYRMPIEGVTV